MILTYSESNILSLSSGSVWSRCLKEMSPIWTPPIWTRHQTKGPSLPQIITLKRCPLLLLVCRCPCATWRRVRMKRKSQSKAGTEIQSSSLYGIVECVLCRELMYTFNLTCCLTKAYILQLLPLLECICQNVLLMFSCTLCCCSSFFMLWRFAVLAYLCTCQCCDITLCKHEGGRQYISILSSEWALFVFLSPLTILLIAHYYQCGCFVCLF